MKQPRKAGNPPIQVIARCARRGTFGGHNRAEPGTGRESGARHVGADNRAALEVYTREQAPFTWGAVQGNLGIVLWTLGERERGTERLKKSRQRRPQRPGGIRP